jgi:2,3-bisphosphoglycerate-dependent phosphoglycerate mutase
MEKAGVEKTVYLVRHGQSEDNIAPVFQSPGSPLSPEGKRQAELIAERATRLSFETLIASPLERARQTAEVIARATGKEAELSPLFVERIKPSRINGKPHDDKEAAAISREWERSLYTPGMRVEDGESFDDLLNRADKALTFLRARPERSLLVVTHGFFLRTMLGRVLLGDALTGAAFQHFQTHAGTENTGVTVLRHGEFEDAPRWRLWVFNDHAHLV